MKQMIGLMLIFLILVFWILTLCFFSLTFEFKDGEKIYIPGWSDLIFGKSE